MSASSTQSRPRFAATRTRSQASIADRFGRNPKLAGEKSASEDRFQHDLRCRHHHPVRHGRDPQRPGLARPSRFRDANPPQRRRPILTSTQPHSEPVEELAHPGSLNVSNADPIDSRSTFVGTDVVPRSPQHVAAGDMAIELMEPTARLRLGSLIEHPLQRTRGIQTSGLSDGSSRNGTHQLTSLLPMHR